MVINFKGSIPENGEKIGAKTESKKDLLKFFQEEIVQNVMRKYTKGIDLAPMIKMLEDVTGNDWELKPPGDNVTSTDIKL